MSKSKNTQHFKNLLSIAFADGILDKSELDFLFRKSDKYFITLSEIEGLIENSIHVKPSVVTDSIERSEQMLDLIEMMLVDGETDENERRLCMIFGVSLGFSSETINELVDKVVSMIDDERSTYQILQTIQNFE